MGVENNDAASELIDLHDVHELVQEALGSAARGRLSLQLPHQPLPYVLGDGRQLRSELRRRAGSLVAGWRGRSSNQTGVLQVTGHVAPERPAALMLELAVEARAVRMELPLAGAIALV